MNEGLSLIGLDELLWVLWPHTDVLYWFVVFSDIQLSLLCMLTLSSKDGSVRC